MRMMAVSGVRIWWDTSARESASALRSRDSWSRVRERRDTIFDSSLASTATSPSRQFEKSTVRPECSTSSISSASRQIWRWRYSDTTRNTASSTAPVPATHGFTSLGAAHASTATSAAITAHWRKSVDAEPTLLAPSCRGGALHRPHDAPHRPHGLQATELAPSPLLPHLVAEAAHGDDELRFSRDRSPPSRAGASHRRSARCPTRTPRRCPK